jgi:hypothetical protein
VHCYDRMWQYWNQWVVLNTSQLFIVKNFKNTSVKLVAMLSNLRHSWRICVGSFDNICANTSCSTISCNYDPYVTIIFAKCNILRPPTFDHYVRHTPSRCRVCWASLEHNPNFLPSPPPYTQTHTHTHTHTESVLRGGLWSRIFFAARVVCDSCIWANMIRCREMRGHLHVLWKPFLTYLN